MTPQEKHRLEVLWANARESKLARKEIARATAQHQAATAKGRIEAERRRRGR
jgi:hypothetical protein